MADESLPNESLLGILNDVPCEICGEPIAWHILGGYGNRVGTEDWHSVTRFKLRPSDIFGDVMKNMIPIQRSVSLQIQE